MASDGPWKLPLHRSRAWRRGSHASPTHRKSSDSGNASRKAAWSAGNPRMTHGWPLSIRPIVRRRYTRSTAPTLPAFPGCGCSIPATSKAGISQSRRAAERRFREHLRRPGTRSAKRGSIAVLPGFAWRPSTSTAASGQGKYSGSGPRRMRLLFSCACLGGRRGVNGAFTLRQAAARRSPCRLTLPSLLTASRNLRLTFPSLMTAGRNLRLTLPSLLTASRNLRLTFPSFLTASRKTSADVPESPCRQPESSAGAVGSADRRNLSVCRVPKDHR